VFESILTDTDAATFIVNELLAHGFCGSLTGGLAIGTHLQARGRRERRRHG
jgi:hypothetical protein